MQALPNAAEDALGAAIRWIGRPGFEEALWDLIRRATGADNLVALAYRGTAPPAILWRRSDAPQVFARVETVFIGGAYLLDPYHELHLTRVPAGLYRLSDVAPDAFHRSRYYEDYYQATTLEDELAFIAWPGPDVSVFVCAGRDATSGRAFSAPEVAAARRLAPVMTALIEAHWAGVAAARPSAPDDGPTVAASLIAALDAAHGIHLSPRQAEVALLILRGHSTASIALRLDRSAQTVKVFRKQLYARCRISSQAELFSLLLPLLGRDAGPGTGRGRGRGRGAGAGLSRCGASGRRGSCCRTTGA